MALFNEGDAFMGAESPSRMRALTPEGAGFEWQEALINAHSSLLAMVGAI
jgi:hypothetical protein